MSLDEEKEIWSAVMDHAGDEVPTEKPADARPETVTADTVTPSEDAQTETSTTTADEVTSSDVFPETDADAASSEDALSQATSMTTETAVEVDLKPVTAVSDLSSEAQDETATLTQIGFDEPVVTETEETTTATAWMEKSVSSETTEESSVSKIMQEETLTREEAPQTVKLMTASESTPQRPTVEATEETATPTENKDSHHIGHNLKVVTWTLAGVCLSVVVIGNFLGIYFSYIKPRMHQSILP